LWANEGVNSRALMGRKSPGNVGLRIAKMKTATKLVPRKGIVWQGKKISGVTRDFDDPRATSQKVKSGGNGRGQKKPSNCRITTDLRERLFVSNTGQKGR